MAEWRYKLVVPILRTKKLDLDFYIGSRNSANGIGIKGRF